MFTEWTLAYADLDGWSLEELPEIAPLSRIRNSLPGSKPEKKVVPWRELGFIHQQFLSCLLGLQSISDLAVKESEHIKGGMGLDLLAANAPELAELLLRSGFVALSDGQARLKDDPQLVACGTLLQKPESQKILIKSSLLSWRKSRSEDPAGNAARVIGTLARQLGGYGELCGIGKSKYKVFLPNPRE